MGLGERIKIRRAILGWTQDDLAQRTGVKAPTISRIETGETPNPSIDTVCLLADALQVDLNWLVKGLELDDEPAPSEDPAAFEEFLRSPVAHDVTGAEKDELRRLRFKGAPTVDAYAYFLMAIRKTKR